MRLYVTGFNYVIIIVRSSITMMNKVELKAKLEELGINSSEYSLDGAVTDWNTLVLYKNYSIWEVFI